HVHSGENAATFDGTGALLAHLDAVIGIGETLSVFLPRLATDAVRGFMALLERHRIEVVLTADSAPEAADYLAQTLLGAAAGGVSGILGGVWPQADRVFDREAPPLDQIDHHLELLGAVKAPPRSESAPRSGQAHTARCRGDRLRAPFPGRPLA